MRTDKSLAPEPARADARRRPAAVVLNTSAVASLMAAADWTKADLARQSGLDQSAVARLIDGQLRPGWRAIGGLVQAFTGRFPMVGFYELFDVVDGGGAVLRPQQRRGEDGEAIRAAS